jgi:hypothetical protein
VILILALGAGCAPGGRSALPVADRSPGGTPSGYADLKGLRMYYEIQGTGRPPVLIQRAHGGTEKGREAMKGSVTA